jgi:hypothetical protein
MHCLHQYRRHPTPFVKLSNEPELPTLRRFALFWNSFQNASAIIAHAADENREILKILTLLYCHPEP